MKTATTFALVVCALFVGAFTAFAQGPRKDVIWARSTNGAPITLDGVLDEPSWNAAESIVIRYAYDTGIPGSGWKQEGLLTVTDSTYATLKFLTVGNQLYMAATVRDSSVGGSNLFNRFDGFLMSIKNHLTAGAPKPPNEYLYSWWYPVNPGTPPAGQLPSFKGVWAEEPVGSPRTPEQIANWNAVTKVHGLSNSDAVADTGYTVEMRFNLTPEGYDITQAAGDIIEWNISIYDCDWFWPNQGRNSANRVWWQGPWGGDALYNEVRIHAKPSVTVSSGTVPTILPELIIPNASGFLSPNINGLLSESVWASAPSFVMEYGNDALRATYPGVFAYRAGQYQPPVNGGTAFVDDPGRATIKYFFKEDTLYLGFDVNDRKVNYRPDFDRWDGFIVSLNDRAAVSGDNNLTGRRLSFQVGQNGAAIAQDYLAYLKDVLGTARVATALKPGTTVDTTGLDDDQGYTAELAIDLTSLGYPKGRGDGVLFMGITLLDGDSYTPFTDSYGTRTWWMREYEGSCCPTWAYMNPNVGVVGVEDGPPRSSYFQLLGNHPNPSNERTTIRFVMARAGDVTLDVYDVQGRLVKSQGLGALAAGERSAAFETGSLRSGVYLYRLRMMDRATRTMVATLSGNMLVIR